MLGRALLAGIVCSVALRCVAAPDRLPAEVDAALARAKVPSTALSVVVQEVGASAPRLEWRAAQPSNPASVMKLVTTLAALELLGPSWNWSTPVWLDGSLRLPQGVLQGDLVIKGSGDPTLVLERLWLLLRRVQHAGVREIDGDIVLDRSAFRVVDRAPGDFDGEPLRPYNAQPDALLLNYRALTLAFTPRPALGVASVSVDPPLKGVAIDATVPLNDAASCGDWRSGLKLDADDPARIRFRGSIAAACAEKTWPLAYADPASYNARAIEALWREAGGRLSGRVRDGSAPAARPPSFEFASPPLAQVVRDINKYSNNVMAQQLFLTLALQRQPALPATAEAARALLQDWLLQRGGDLPAGTQLDNGSGLSRDTRLSAALLARLLQQAWSGPAMPELVSSLPINGLDGTLRRSRATAGRAHLKTGSLRDVTGIAGYVLSDSGRRYVLVAIINHPQANAARPALDALVQWSLRDAPSR